MIKNFKQFLFIAGLLLIAAGAQPVGAAFWQWSTTPASNATADPNINWAEGMSPSSVNDSARAMMAALAVRNKDLGLAGLDLTNPAAIVASTNTGYPNIAALNGQLIIAQSTSAATNSAGATINVDSVGALPLYQGTSPVPAGLIEDRGVYSFICYSSNSRCYLVDNHANPYNVPLGSILWSTLSTPPNANFIVPAGQCISTTTYNAYWVALGSPASGGCPGGQFAIVDMGGRVAAALDTLPGFSAKNRLTSSSAGCGTAMTAVGAVCAGGLEFYTLLTANLPPYTPVGSVSTPSITNPTGSVLATNGTINNTPLNGGPASVAPLSSTSWFAASLQSSTPLFSGSPQGGTSTAFSKVQPTIGLIPYLRVL